MKNKFDELKKEHKILAENIQSILAFGLGYEVKVIETHDGSQLRFEKGKHYFVINGSIEN